MRVQVANESSSYGMLPQHIVYPDLQLKYPENSEAVTTMQHHKSQSLAVASPTRNIMNGQSRINHLSKYVWNNMEQPSKFNNDEQSSTIHLDHRVPGLQHLLTSCCDTLAWQMLLAVAKSEKIGKNGIRGGSFRME